MTLFSYSIPQCNVHLDGTNITRVDRFRTLLSAIVASNAGVPSATGQSVALTQTLPAVSKKTITMLLSDAERATRSIVPALDRWNDFFAVSALDIWNDSSTASALDIWNDSSTASALDIWNDSSAMLALEQSKRNSILGKIFRYSELPEDFDGYDGHAPDMKDICNACLFISHIPVAGLNSVRTMVAGDGDVGFKWDDEKHPLEVGFCEGTISFFGIMPDGKTLNDDVDFDENNIPEKLQRLMDAILRK